MVSDKLAAFLHEASSRKFEWGRFDCGLWLADWYVFATGSADPAAHLRYAYSDEASCKALCGALGPARVVHRIAKNAGLKRTYAPMRGDIAVLRNKDNTLVVGAIATRLGYAFLGIGGGLNIEPKDRLPNVRVLASWKMVV